MNEVWCIRPLDIKYVTKNTGKKNKKFYHIKRIQKLLLSYKNYYYQFFFFSNPHNYSNLSRYFQCVIFHVNF